MMLPLARGRRAAFARWTRGLLLGASLGCAFSAATMRGSIAVSSLTGQVERIVDDTITPAFSWSQLGGLRRQGAVEVQAVPASPADAEADPATPPLFVPSPLAKFLTVLVPLAGALIVVAFALRGRGRSDRQTYADFGGLGFDIEKVDYAGLREEERLRSLRSAADWSRSRIGGATGDAGSGDGNGKGRSGVSSGSGDSWSGGGGGFSGGGSSGSW